MATLKSSKIVAKVQADGSIMSAIKQIELEVLSFKSNPTSLRMQELMAQAKMVGQWLQVQQMVI